jgi:hypothetical protein
VCCGGLLQANSRTCVSASDICLLKKHRVSLTIYQQSNWTKGQFTTTKPGLNAAHVHVPPGSPVSGSPARQSRLNSRQLHPVYISSYTSLLSTTRALMH